MEVVVASSSREPVSFLRDFPRYVLDEEFSSQPRPNDTDTRLQKVP